MAVLAFQKNYAYEVDYTRSETYFRERLLRSLLDMGVDGVREYIESVEDLNTVVLNTCTPKLHTFRKKTKPQRKVGGLLHPSTGVRTKEHVQFAPTIEIKGLQDLEFIWVDAPNNTRLLTIKIGKKEFEAASMISGIVSWTSPELINIAANDGFSSVKIFLKWFSKSGKYQIIHWTDLKY